MTALLGRVDALADQGQLLGIQETATLLDVSMRTLRFYEDKGLIAPQRVGTTRIYSRREIGRMRLILRGKHLGFTLRDIKEFLDLYDVDPEHHQQVRQLLGKVAERMAELRRQKRAIDQTLVELRLIEAQALAWLDARGHGRLDEGRNEASSG